MKIKTKIIVCICALVGIAAISIAIVLLISRSKTLNVSFDTEGGSHIPMQTVKKGEKVQKPVDPIKTDYSFVRWEYNNKEYDFTSSVESDMTLRAIWKKNETSVKKYKITFNVEGKTKTIEVSDASEINVSNLGFEEKSGYILKWYANDKEYDLETPLTSDISIEGKYEKIVSYTVKFNSNGGTSVSNQTINTGEKVKEPTNVKREGYILDGWYLNNQKYNFNTVVTGNITLIAKWSEDLNVKRYEVKFNSDGGSSVSSQRIIENKTVTQPKNPTKSGYAFEGWYLNNSKYNFNSKVTSNITLVAKWRELVKYKVTFDSDGGSNVSAQTITEGEKVTKPANPTRSGYTFKEWQLNGRAYDFNSSVTGSIILVATWTKDPNKYTVTFNSNGGSTVSSQTIVEGNKATKPANPTRSGYTFKEWQLNGRTYDFNSSVTGSITLTAVWNALPSYTVAFNSNGGSAVSSQTIVEGNKATKPVNPTRSGYTFKEWQLNGRAYDFNSSVTGSITLTAVWNAKNYTIQKTKVDATSLDVKLTVKEEGQVISFNNIMYNNRVVCTSSNPYVNESSISSITSFQVTLTDGTVVNANVS